MGELLPPELCPTGSECIGKPPQDIAVPKATPSFRRWQGPVPGDSYGGKPILDANGEPAFAEVVILRALQRAGWDGVWVDTYRKSYRRSSWGDKVSSLPQEPAALLAEIRSIAEDQARCWDVFCWRSDGAVLFAEAKRAGRDRIRESQVAWFKAALHLGRRPREFLVVEWSLE